MTEQNFEDLGLDSKILKAIEDSGYTEPTPIQLKAIPKILRGFDVRGSAQTGTGKTAAFLLPALHRLATPTKTTGKGPRILILVPTRELAMQIGGQAEKYSAHMQQIKTLCVYGGVPYHSQERKLARHLEILIATPGRLIDFMQQGKVNFNRLEMLILDEADRMLDMGFKEPVEQIVAKTPETRQTLLFSATLQGSVLKLSDRLQNKPMDIVVQHEKAKHDNIEQKLHYVNDLYHKNQLLDHILETADKNHILIFTSTKRHADKLAYELKDKGHRSAPLHGDMSQRQRTRTIANLHENKIDIVVATDVAARGIDVKTITHVINFDLPRDPEDYVHRIGRTGRAGSTGIAHSFAAGMDKPLVGKIEKFTGFSIKVEEFSGMEPRPMKKGASKPGPRSNSGKPGKRPFNGKSGGGKFGSKSKPSFGAKRGESKSSGPGGSKFGGKGKSKFSPGGKTRFGTKPKSRSR